MTSRAAQVLNHPCAFPGPVLHELRDSSPQLADTARLHERLAEDGYIFLRGLLPREVVLESRRALVGELAERGLLQPGSDPMDAIANPEAKSGVSSHSADITSRAPFRAVVEHPAIFELIARLRGGPAMTFTEKWLRVTKPGVKNFTGAHMDIVYMGRGTQHLLTCWIPHGDAPVEHGPVALVPGSHRDPAFARIRDTYGRSDVDRDRTEGWFSRDAAEIAALSSHGWATADFRAGDAVLFGMFTMHGSCANLSDRIRLSSDTRYQRADEPFDPRWAGPNPTGHSHAAAPLIPIAESRRAWAV